MLKPVYYLQGDKKWGSHNYSAKGERKTIASSGCGPTSAAMVIETLRPDLEGAITPVETAEWSMKHGYKYLNQGTAYSYFSKQMTVYSITCNQLNSSNHYHSTNTKLENKVYGYLKNPGYFVIACMGVGNWTSGGHYVVAYGIDDNDNVYINDPASKGEGKTGYPRTKAPWNVFKREVKYFWSIKWGINYKIKGAETKRCALYEKNDSTSKKIEKINGGKDIWLIRDMKNGWSLVATSNNVGYMKNTVINAVGLSSYKKCILASDVTVYEKNSSLSAKLFKITAGNEVKIITRRKNWSNVVAPNGAKGWIKTKFIDEVLNKK